MVDEERFARPDTSVAGQVLKLVAANPDAILIGASGTAAALPQTDAARTRLQGPDLSDPRRRQHGLHPHRRKGGRRRDHGVGSGDVAGNAADSALTKKPGLALNTAYEAKYGANSRSQFAGHSYDAFEVLKRVIPVALKAGKPGTPEFREGIRQALLTEQEIAASQGVYNFTEKDRYGLDDRSRIILTVKDGKYVPAK